MSRNLTFQSEGGMLVLVDNQTNWGESPWQDPPATHRWLATGQTILTYEPKESPPTAWSNGRQYDSPAAASISRIPRSGSSAPAGIASAAASIYYGPQRLWVIRDRGQPAVEPEKSYRFRTALLAEPNFGLQFAFTLRGVAGGSVVEPEFGLFNTPENPDSWFYARPSGAFTGSWSFRVRNPNFDTLLKVDVDYVEPGLGQWPGFQTANSGAPQAYSRLIFTLTGAVAQAATTLYSVPIEMDLLSRCGQSLV
ncbi:MAG: hypothetical protein AAFY88_04400 [Acidobacteriota bacterium]